MDGERERESENSVLSGLLYGAQEGFSDDGELLFGNHDVCNWLIPSYPHLLVIFFSFVEVVKELRTEKEKNRDF